VSCRSAAILVTQEPVIPRYLVTSAPEYQNPFTAICENSSRASKTTCLPLPDFNSSVVTLCFDSLLSHMYLNEFSILYTNVRLIRFLER
jgi:hypothetical protein